jgi:hypothetical protein
MDTNIGKSSYHIWHRNLDIPGTWLCAGCYASRYFAPKKKFKTKQEQYMGLSKLFSGKGNPMYDVHINIGRTHTPERNKKVSQAVKKWADKHLDFTIEWEQYCSLLNFQDGCNDDVFSFCTLGDYSNSYHNYKLRILLYIVNY